MCQTNLIQQIPAIGFHFVCKNVFPAGAAVKASQRNETSCVERGTGRAGPGMFRFEGELLAAKLVDFPLVRTERDGVGLYGSLKRDSKEDYAGG